MDLAVKTKCEKCLSSTLDSMTLFFDVGVPINVFTVLLFYYILSSGVGYIQLQMCDAILRIIIFAHLSFSYNSQLSAAFGMKSSVIGYIAGVTKHFSQWAA